MPVRQYFYFALSSKRTSAAAMTAHLGIEPDEVLVRGSRTTQPAAIPTTHKWQMVCREPRFRIDEQISCVLDRLAPHTPRIAELVRRLATEDDSANCAAVLEVVRYFNDDAPADDAPQTRAAEPPNLLGWHLDRTVLDFLTATGAILDVDEYDTTPGVWPPR
ncbi:DUF4279 domain-containing protein [Streptodolium elevatio]